MGSHAGKEDACAAKQTQLNQAVHGLHGLAKAFRLQLENAEDVAAAVKQLTALDASGLDAEGEGCTTQVGCARLRHLLGVACTCVQARVRLQCAVVSEVF